MTRETIFFALLLRASCPSRYLRSLEKRKKDDARHVLHATCARLKNAKKMTLSL